MHGEQRLAPGRVVGRRRTLFAQLAERPGPALRDLLVEHGVGGVDRTVRLVTTPQLRHLLVERRLHRHRQVAAEVERALEPAVERLRQPEPIGVTLPERLGAVEVVVAQPELDDLHQLVGGELLGGADQHRLVACEGVCGAGQQRPGEDAGVAGGDRTVGQGCCRGRHGSQLASQMDTGADLVAGLAGARRQPVGHGVGGVALVEPPGLEVGDQPADGGIEPLACPLEPEQEVGGFVAIELLALDLADARGQGIDVGLESFDGRPEHAHAPPCNRWGSVDGSGAGAPRSSADPTMVEWRRRPATVARTSVRVNTSDEFFTPTEP